MGGLDVRMRGVACRHGRVEAVAEVDPEIAAGERVARSTGGFPCPVVAYDTCGFVR